MPADAHQVLITHLCAGHRVSRFATIVTGFAASGGAFKLELFLPEDYPMAAPKVCMLCCAPAACIESDALSLMYMYAQGSPGSPSSSLHKTPK